MTIQAKTQATCRMYLQAVRTGNTELQTRFQNRANDLYRETYSTEYSQTNLREHILFGIANGRTDFYFLQDIEIVNKALANI